jgi:hypothetical protein
VENDSVRANAVSAVHRERRQARAVFFGPDFLAGVEREQSEREAPVKKGGAYM